MKDTIVGTIIGILLGLSSTMLIVGSTGCTSLPRATKMEHAVIAQYVCSKLDSGVKEFLVTPTNKGYSITMWCDNSITITVDVPEAKPNLKEA